MKKLLALCTSALLALGLSVGGATVSASAGDTCPDGSDGWVKTDSGQFPAEQLSWTPTAPHGTLIAEVCYKASNAFGTPPVIASPVSSVPIVSDVSNGHGGFHAISHFSLRLVVNPDVPSFTDACGTANDGYTVPSTASDYYTYGVVDNRVGGVGTVTITANKSAAFDWAPGVTGVWSHNFTDVPCEVVVPDPTAPSFSDVCGTDNDDFTVPADTVDYDYSFVDSRVAGVGLVTITATAVVGGAETEWEHTFTDVECPVTPVPTAPSFNDVCGVDNDSYVVPADTADFDYSYTDARVAGVGLVTITATAVVGGAQTEWEHTFTDVECPVTTVPTAPSFNDVCDVKNDSYVVPADTDHYDFSVVDTRVDGVGLVTITATPLAGGDATQWSHEFTDEECVATLETDPRHSTCISGREGTAFDTWIWVELQEGVQYKIDGVNVHESNPYNEVTPGPHTVTAEALAGFTIDPESEVEWIYNVKDSSKECTPTLGFFDAGATATNASCVNPSGTLQFHRPADHVGFVNYLVDGVSVGAVVTSLNKAPGNYVVTAEPVNPLDTVNSPGPWNLTIAAFTGECLPTLAFTGADADQPLQLAGGMVMLGLLGLYLRRRMVLSAAK